MPFAVGLVGLVETREVAIWEERILRGGREGSDKEGRYKCEGIKLLDSLVICYLKYSVWVQNPYRMLGRDVTTRYWNTGEVFYHWL